MKFLLKGATPSLLVFFAFLYSCSKNSGIPPHPSIDPSAALTWTAPADSIYITSTGSVQIIAKVSGKQDNYSFLTAYFIHADTHDTLKSGSVAADGSISMTWTNTLAPGVYPITIVIPDPGQSGAPITTSTRRLFVCKPPPIVIADFSKDETSITINWEKTKISNFKAYELLVARKDTMRDLPPYPPGEVIATITDINTTSFKHNDVYFYHKYYYVLRVISSEDCQTDSENKGIEAGLSMELPANTPTSRVWYNQDKNRMYFLNISQTNQPVFTVLDPDLLVTEKTVPLAINQEVVFSGLDETGLKVNIVSKTAAKSFQLYSFSIQTDQLSTLEAFELPVNGIIQGVFGKKILYQSFTAAVPAKSQLSLFDASSSGNALIRQMEILNVEAINDNSSFVARALNDSFFVYSVNGGIAQLSGDGYSPVEGYSAHGVFSGEGKIAVGGNLYDESLNMLSSLPANKFFTGVSKDGAYAVTSDNEIYDVSSSDMQLIKKYGDGFGTFPFFSADKSVMYHLTEGSLNPRWNPTARLFRYPL